MQPQKPQKPESGLSSNRSSSISRFIKKTYSFSSKKERQSTSPPVTPEPQLQPEPEPVLGPNGTPPPRIYRPPLHHTPTHEALSTHTTALQKALTDGWPHRHHSRYRDARALLVCWADNDSAANPSISAETYTPPQTSTFQPSSPSPSSLRYSSGSETMASLNRVSSRYNMRDAPSTPVLNRVSSRANMRNPVSTTVPQLDMRQGPFMPAAYQLADVLERRYGVAAQVWMIPSLDSPQDALAAKVKQFVRDYGGPDNLLIFWYGGRAEFVGGAGEGAQGGESGVGEVIWYGLRDELGIPARATTKILGDARADVLMLNDSPFAQHAYTSHTSGPGSFELLGSGSMTPSNIELNPAREASFTRNVTLMLDSPFLASRGISVLDLHRKLLDIMCPINRTSVGTTITMTSTATADTTTTADAATSPKATTTETETQQTANTNSTPQRRRPTSSLVAARAQTVSAANIPSYPIYCQISQSTPLEWDVRRNIVLSRLDVSLAAEGVRAKNAGEPPGVGLSVRLKRPFLDVKKWKEWILRAPADAEGVSVRVLGKKD